MIHPWTSLVVAILFLGLGIAEFVRPFGPPFLRNAPVLIIAGLLLAARYGAGASARRRQKMLNDVPRRPLGLSD